MRRKTRSIILVLLMVALVLSIMGCGTSNNTGTTVGTSAKAADSSVAGASSTGAAAEPVTLKMFIRNQSKYTGIQEDPVAKYVEQKLGIKIDLTVDSSLGTTSSSASTFDELLATKLASNDLDDIMDFGSTGGNPNVFNNLKKAAEAGMIIPLDDLIKNHAPNLSTDPRLTMRNDYRRTNIYTDGKLYSIAGWGGIGADQIPGAGYWVRWDIYKSLGYPVIKTDDDFLDLMKKMQAACPKTPNGEKTYAFGYPFADPIHMGDGAVMGDYPNDKGFTSIENNYAAFLDLKNREVVAPLLDPDSFFWKGLKFYNRANQAGLIDPGSVTMSGSEYNEKFNKGIYLTSLNGWTANNKENQLSDAGMKDAGFMPLKPLDDVQSLYIYWELVLGGNEFAITKNCKNPEKAIEFFDWCNSDEGSRMITQGAEGAAWTNNNGTPVLTETYLKDRTGGSVDVAETYGTWKYAGINGFQHICFDKNGTYIMPEQAPRPDTYSTVKKDWLTHFGTDDFFKYFSTYTNDKGEKLPGIVWGAYTNAIGTKPDDINQKNAQLNQYMFKNVFRLVLAKNDKDFETLKAQVIKQAETMGAKEIADWYGNRFAELKKELDPTLDAAVDAYGIGK